MGILSWLGGEEGRKKRAARFPAVGIKGCYWDGGESSGRPVKDISATGAYLYSQDSLYVGTVLTVTLQQETEACEGEESRGSITVRCKVVRVEENGMGVSFMLDTAKQRKELERFVRRAVSSPSRRSGSAEGQALIEFALIVPLLFFLIVNAVNFGGFIYAWITVANAARNGAQYAALGGASAGAPMTPNNTKVQTLITNDMSSLLGTVSVCVNRNATSSAATGTCSFTIAPIQADPEANYTIVSVDVRYTFSRLIQNFSFPGLGILGLPTMPAFIHRRTLMRSLQ